MTVFMIGYDIHPSKGESYDNLIEAIESLGTTWWHCLESTWLVIHAGPATAIRDALLPHLTKPSDPDGDHLLVARLTGEMVWSLSFSDGCQSWLKKHYSQSAPDIR
jgi:hypothetical protein